MAPTSSIPTRDRKTTTKNIKIKNIAVKSNSTKETATTTNKKVTISYSGYSDKKKTKASGIKRMITKKTKTMSNDGVTMPKSKVLSFDRSMDTDKPMNSSEIKKKKKLKKLLSSRVGKISKKEDMSQISSTSTENQDEVLSTGTDDSCHSIDTDFAQYFRSGQKVNPIVKENSTGEQTVSMKVNKKMANSKAVDNDGANSSKKMASNKGINKVKRSKSVVGESSADYLKKMASNGNGNEEIISSIKRTKPKSVNDSGIGSSKKISNQNGASSFEKGISANEFKRHSLPLNTNTKINVKTENANSSTLNSTGNKMEEMNSLVEGEKALCWLLSPLSTEEFYQKYWEKNPCFLHRQKEGHFNHLISFEAIDKMLLDHHLEFTKNIDITSYTNGCRETHNPGGRALPPVVWDYYGQGMSIRLLNPQTFLKSLHAFCAILQEHFHCMVGANAYLTPPNSQGFAPHYDDIEAFVLQVEGRKRWRLYGPRTSADILPRYSSRNLTQEEIGEPIFDQVLGPGDVLYFPRGVIHQALTLKGHHSLHITLSAYQRQSYADLFEKMMPLLLQRAIAQNVELRRGLPLRTFQNAGVAFNGLETVERAQFLGKARSLITTCFKEVPFTDIIDSAIDQLAKRFQHEALPPHIYSAEQELTIYGSKSHPNAKGECICDYDLTLTTNVRLLRANILRLVRESDDSDAYGNMKMRVYYYVDNSKEYCQYEPNFIDITAFEGASIEVLMTSYPAYISISQLPLSKDRKKIELATALFERGLLMTEKPYRNV